MRVLQFPFLACDDYRRVCERAFATDDYETSCVLAALPRSRALQKAYRRPLYVLIAATSTTAATTVQDAIVTVAVGIVAAIPEVTFNVIAQYVLRMSTAHGYYLALSTGRLY